MAYPPESPPVLKTQGAAAATHEESHAKIQAAIDDLKAELGSNPKGTFADLESRMADTVNQTTNPSWEVDWSSMSTFGILVNINSFYPLANSTLLQWQINAPSSGLPTAGTVSVELRKNGVGISTITWDLAVDGSKKVATLNVAANAGDEIVPFVNSVTGIPAGEELKNVAFRLSGRGA